jgi:predicted nucleic acid-binding protein
MLAINAAPVYFDCVVTEAISAAVRRMQEKGRGGEVQGLLSRLHTHVPRETITWILSDAPRLYSQVIELIGSTSGEINFNDGLIALACRERDVPVLASFDPDFDQISWLKRVAAPEDVTALHHQ